MIIHSNLLERVFDCYNPFETRKDYKEIFPTMWVNYKYLDKSFVGQYFKVGCDVISVTMTTLKVHKKNLKISVFAIYLKKSVTYPFYCIFGKLPKFFNFCDGMAKSYSVELQLYRKSHLCNSKKFH